MATYISNAFSLNMVNVNNFTLLRARKVTASDIPQTAISAIGHADTARVVSGILGYEVIANRMNISLQNGDVLYVAQYKGTRLPEGATQLPEGATIEFLEITLKPEGCNGCFAYEYGEGGCNPCKMINWTHGR